MRIVITGASGVVGTILRRHYESRGGDTVVVAVAHPSDRPTYIEKNTFFLDLATCPDSDIEACLTGADVVIHLSALSSSHTPWSNVMSNNLVLDEKIFRACVSTKVRRIVFASSNHVNNGITMSPSNDWDPNTHDLRYLPGGLISISDPMCPDSYYACEKAMGEALGRYFSIRYGLEVVCLRIGWVRQDNNPTTAPPEQLNYIRAIYLSHEDCKEVFDRAVAVPLPVSDVGVRGVHGCAAPGGKSAPFLLAYAVSDNRRGIFNAKSGNAALGFVPRGDAEPFFSKL